MRLWRVGYGIALLVFVAMPLAMPFRDLFDADAWSWTSNDLLRLGVLASNTFFLTAATTALAVPCGICLAVLLFRTSFFGRRVLLFLLALTLFVPSPVVVATWQVLLGVSRPLANGMGPAIWIHTLVAVPWVAFIVGLGLTWVEPELEEAALQIVGPWQVVALVSLPRVRASVLAAALFVILQTAGDTNVTELVLVPTLADELRLQFATNERTALARTLLLSLPLLAAMVAGTLAAVRYLEQHLPRVTPPARPQRSLDLRPIWVRYLLVGVPTVLLMAPIAGLAWKVGAAGHPAQWSESTAWHYLQSESRVLARGMYLSLAASAVAGIAIASVALIGCWLARDSRWLRWSLFIVLTCAWVLPGPVVGIGLHDLIMTLPPGPLKTMFYFAPSPAPLLWAQMLRTLPVAVVFLWPVVRMVPREWFEEARLGGAGPLSEFLHIVAPLTWRATLLTGLATAALCLGEVAACGRVETAGWEPFAKTLLDRMHYDVDNALAALSVMLLASLTTLGLIVVFGSWIVQSLARRT